MSGKSIPPRKWMSVSVDDVDTPAGTFCSPLSEVRAMDITKPPYGVKEVPLAVEISLEAMAHKFGWRKLLDTAARMSGKD